MSPRLPAAPQEQSDTPRARLRDLLIEASGTARELSERGGLSEKDVLHHLEHLARSARGRGERLVVEPSTCLGCDYVFRDRERLAKPGSCPRCRGTRITPPRFRLET